MRDMKKIIAYLMAAIILVQLASAIGISPAKEEINLDSRTAVGSGRIRIINNEQRDMRVVIEAQGHLKDYIEFDRKDFLMPASQGADIVEYTIDASDIPASELRSAKISIYIIEIPPAISLTATGAAAGTAAIQKLIINVPAEISASEKKEISQAEEISETKSAAEEQEAAYVPLDEKITEEGPDYVPLKGNIDEKPAAELEEPEKGNRHIILYIVLGLVFLNLLWLFFVLHRRKGDI